MTKDPGGVNMPPTVHPHPTDPSFPSTGPPVDDSPPDPFDQVRLRLAETGDADLGVREVLVSVPYRKPSKEHFFRIHPSQDYRAIGGVIELKENDADTFWVDPSLWSSLLDEPTFGKRLIVTAITRQGLLFLWGCRLPGLDGKMPDWITYPLEAIEEGKKRWTKIFWDLDQRRHRIKVSDHLLDEPKWPAMPFRNLLELAFKGKVIDSLEHPVLKKLRGEI